MSDTSPMGTRSFLNSSPVSDSDPVGFYGSVGESVKI